MSSVEPTGFIAHHQSLYSTRMNQLTTNNENVARKLHATELEFVDTGNKIGDTVLRLKAKRDDVLDLSTRTGVKIIGPNSTLTRLQQKQDKLMSMRSRLDELLILEASQLGDIEYSMSSKISQVRKQYEHQLQQVECKSVHFASIPSPVTNEMTRVNDALETTQKELKQLSGEYTQLTNELGGEIKKAVSDAKTCAQNGTTTSKCDSLKHRIDELQLKTARVHSKKQTLIELYETLKIDRAKLEKQANKQLDMCTRDQTSILKSMQRDIDSIIESHKHEKEEKTHWFERERADIRSGIVTVEQNVGRLQEKLKEEFSVTSSPDDTAVIQTHMDDIVHIQQKLHELQSDEAKLHVKMVKLLAKRDKIRDDYFHEMNVFLQIEHMWHSLSKYTNSRLPILMQELLTDVSLWNKHINEMFNQLKDLLKGFSSKSTEEQVNVVANASKVVESASTDASTITARINDVLTKIGETDMSCNTSTDVPWNDTIETAQQVCQQTLDNIIVDVNKLSNHIKTITYAHSTLNELKDVIQSLPSSTSYNKSLSEMLGKIQDDINKIHTKKKED